MNPPLSSVAHLLSQIAELDTPYNLIRKENGVFRSMCLKSGTFSELEEAAKQKGEASSS